MSLAREECDNYAELYLQLKVQQINSTVEIESEPVSNVQYNSLKNELGELKKMVYAQQLELTHLKEIYGANLSNTVCFG